MNSVDLLERGKYDDIKNCNVYILTLPTPINKKRLPDITLVENATKDLAKIFYTGLNLLGTSFSYK